VPIVSVNLDGVWGSISVLPAGDSLEISAADSLPSASHLWKAAASDGVSQEVRRAVQDLGAEAFARRKKHMHTLPESFIYSARRHLSASPWPTGRGRN